MAREYKNIYIYIYMNIYIYEYKSVSMARRPSF